MIKESDLRSLVKAANNAGFKMNVNDLKIEILKAGMKTHIPTKLWDGYSAVYIFKYKTEYLKVGKVNPKSNPRYQYQHYNPKSNDSTLAKSMGKDGNWIKENISRVNILIPSQLGKKFVHFAEAFFILKCNPKFENSRT